MVSRDTTKVWSRLQCPFPDEHRARLQAVEPAEWRVHESALFLAITPVVSHIHHSFLQSSMAVIGCRLAKPARHLPRPAWGKKYITSTPAPRSCHLLRRCPPPQRPRAGASTAALAAASAAAPAPACAPAPSPAPSPASTGAPPLARAAPLAPLAPLAPAPAPPRQRQLSGKGTPQKGWTLL